ncbi:unnamed protein product, partial [Staurois parvus]
MDGLIAQVGTYHGTTLEFTELLRVTYSFTIVCRSSVYTCGHGVNETPESNDLEGCHNKFGNKVFIYLKLCSKVCI